MAHRRHLAYASEAGVGDLYRIGIGEMSDQRSPKDECNNALMDKGDGRRLVVGVIGVGTTKSIFAVCGVLRVQGQTQPLQLVAQRGQCIQTDAALARYAAGNMGCACLKITSHIR